MPTDQPNPNPAVTPTGATAQPTPAAQPTHDQSRFRPIVGTLAYLWDRTADKVLLVRRIARSHDEQFGRVNGLGGKVENGEDIASAMQRELAEEAAIQAQQWSLRGTVTFKDFGPKRQQWLCFLFLITDWQGDIPASNEEGPLEWISRELLLQRCAELNKFAETHQPHELDSCGELAELLPIWAGDRHFIPLIFEQRPEAFHACSIYDGEVSLEFSHVWL